MHDNIVDNPLDMTNNKYDAMLRKPSGLRKLIRFFFFYFIIIILFLFVWFVFFLGTDSSVAMIVILAYEANRPGLILAIDSVAFFLKSNFAVFYSSPMLKFIIEVKLELDLMNLSTFFFS